jgi:hypothetical protein
MNNNHIWDIWDIEVLHPVLWIGSLKMQIYFNYCTTNMCFLISVKSYKTELWKVKVRHDLKDLTHCFVAISEIRIWVKQTHYNNTQQPDTANKEIRKERQHTFLLYAVHYKNIELKEFASGRSPWQNTTDTDSMVNRPHTCPSNT